jgi:hypothetical protein
MQGVGYMIKEEKVLQILVIRAVAILLLFKVLLMIENIWAEFFAPAGSCLVFVGSHVQIPEVVGVIRPHDISIAFGIALTCHVTEQTDSTKKVSCNTM